MRKIALALLTFFVFAVPAYAQTCPAKLTGRPIEDAKAAAACKAASTVTNAATSAITELSKTFQDIADFIGDEIDGAARLSIATDIKDGNGEQCWLAMRTFGKVIKAHPVPITFKVAQDLQALRLVAIAANKLCADAHCTQVFADASNAVQTVGGGQLPIPSLNSLCAKVPQVAVVEPVPLPADMTEAPAVTPIPTPQ